MRAFLSVADTKEESDPRLQVWIKQVRNVAYDIEDILDEFILRLANNHRNGFFGFLLVSVAGLGGLGTAALVEKVYEETKVKRRFRSHVWITVSQSFKIEELLKQASQLLFDEVKQPVPQVVETMASDSLKELIKEFLQQSRYLLVLDDLWS
ncbi:hypothetical protein RJ640_017759 [Escallonia rubra]|uniref:NB-ARC domain-containing protein n=1 Tax=Escallonia rubra TaxID=112253 RepID=A0AA88UQY6_9ASTE|nr:hypothetical protein RJ640_017759 [Escallonia rubra]